MTEQNEMQQAVAVVKDKQRYLDDCLRTISGVAPTIEEMKLDLRILKTIRLRKINREGQLASYVGLKMRDEAFQSSLSRLETFGLITRTVRKWGYRGEWIDLADDDRKVDSTARGEDIAMSVAEVVS